jgi:hypothetical protein
MVNLLSAKSKINVDVAFYELCRQIIRILEGKAKQKKKSALLAMKPKPIPSISIPTVSPSTLQQDMCQFLHSNALTDFVFEIKGKEICVHKSILLCLAPSFHKVRFPMKTKSLF